MVDSPPQDEAVEDSEDVMIPNQEELVSPEK